MPVCEGLRLQVEFLKRLQVKKDQEEHKRLTKSHGTLASASASASALAPPSNDIVDDQAMDDEVHPVDDSTFLNWLDASQSKPAENVDRNDFVNSTNKADDNAEADVEGFIHPPLTSYHDMAQPPSFKFQHRHPLQPQHSA